MSGTIVCIAAVALGIDPGWQRMDDGGWRYLIQIDPVTLEELKSGRLPHIESDIPPQLKNISCRITVGRKDVPRDELPAVKPAGEVPAPRRPARSEPGPSARVRPEAPGRLPSSPDVRPLGDHPASFEEPVAAKPKADGPPAEAAASAAGEPPKPWWPFTLALATAFGCFGGMLYLGWIAWDYRTRYQRLSRHLADAGLETAGEPG